MRSAVAGLTRVTGVSVVAIVAMLAWTVIPAYQDYQIRAQVYDGLRLAGDVKTAVADFYKKRGAWPVDNAAAGIAAPTSISGDYVKQVEVMALATGAAVDIEFGNNADAVIQGQRVRLTPTDTDGSMRWICSSEILDRYLPTQCR